jgi:acetoin utilization protein AcuB
MQIQNWMTRDVITADENTSIIVISRLLKERNIRHLPITREGKLAGLITFMDIQEALPSKSTTLNAHELHHLLAETRAKDIMEPDPVTIRPEQTIEVAAVKMLEHKIAGIPVVRENNEIVGIISQGDVFRVLISITGIYQGGIQLAFNLEDRGGAIKEVADIMRDWQGQIVSILSTSDTADEGYRNTFIRIKKIPEDRLQGMIEELNQRFMLLYVIRDPLKEV